MAPRAALDVARCSSAVAERDVHVSVDVGLLAVDVALEHAV